MAMNLSKNYEFPMVALYACCTCRGSRRREGSGANLLIFMVMDWEQLCVNAGERNWPSGVSQFFINLDKD